MKNVISILILIITFGCNENRKNNIYQKKANVIDSININDDALILKGIIKYEEKNIDLNTEISEINKKDTKATYSIIATYLGSAINDYYSFGFEGENGKYKVLFFHCISRTMYCFSHINRYSNISVGKS